MASMIDILQELVSPAMLSGLARQTGESESAVSSGFSAAIPVIAAAIANRCDDHSFMKDLAGLATRTAADPDPLRGIGGLASSVSAIDTSTPTGSWLSDLFGKNLSTVTDSIGRYAGIRGSSAASLISIGAPLVLGYIGRLIRSDNLSVSDLADRFRGQRAQLASAMPAGFELPEFLRAPLSPAGAAADAAARRRVAAPAGNWAAPMLALLAALGLGGLAWWAAHKPAQQARVDMSEAARTAAGTSGVIADKITKTLPGSVNITIPAGSAEDQLIKYLTSGGGGSTSVNVERISFDRGSATLTPNSREQLDNIAAILRAYPKATVMVSGHTDNVGSEAANVALSKARAEAVAKSLTSAGVADDRVHAEGYGSAKPVADNSTEAGRSQNRRVGLEVEAK